MDHQIPQRGDLVRVTWLDADSDSGWQPNDPEADDNADPLESFGLLVSKGHKFITLSHAHNKDADEWLGKHRIPINFVEKVEVILKLGHLYAEEEA